MRKLTETRNFLDLKRKIEAFCLLGAQFNGLVFRMQGKDGQISGSLTNHSLSLGGAAEREPTEDGSSFGEGKTLLLVDDVSNVQFGYSFLLGYWIKLVLSPRHQEFCHTFCLYMGNQTGEISLDRDSLQICLCRSITKWLRLKNNYYLNFSLKDKCFKLQIYSLQINR